MGFNLSVNRLSCVNWPSNVTLEVLGFGSISFFYSAKLGVNQDHIKLNGGGRGRGEYSMLRSIYYS
jgi:hypothetical protein